MSKRAKLRGLIGIVFSIAPFSLGISAPPPAANRPPSATELRREVEKAASAREAASRSPLVWEENAWLEAESGGASATRRDGLVEVAYEPEKLPGYLVFRPRDSSGDPAPVRMCITEAGTETIRLAPGEWEAVMELGPPGEAAIKVPPRSVRVRAGRRYRLGLSADAAKELRERAKEEAARSKAAGNKEPAKRR